VLPDQPSPDHIRPVQVPADHMRPDHMRPDQTSLDHMRPDHMRPDQVVAVQLLAVKLDPDHMRPFQVPRSKPSPRCASMPASRC
jgi:hypothetical protein